ncbi:MAG TPA: DPP IV N-terminal domain-containing protein, partial [Blastocatellia bacterium]|nr:DPP IV N-terminal domain-containing protein [Blastocatellia bacterium]
MKRVSACIAAAVIVLTALPGVFAQKKYTIEQFLSPAYPFELVSAAKSDRIAWIAYERGLRNVYTATAPDFKPVRLTANLEDDGNDLSTLSISDDGSVVVFIQGHMPNREGWVANPSSNPEGAERSVWATRTTGGKPWRVAVANNAVLSPDGEWVLYTKDGQIYRASAGPQKGISKGDKERPLFRAFGSNGSPRWSPDSTRIAFVSNRGDHSFIGIYDVMKRRITYLSPSVDRDTSPAWSPDGKSVAFIRRPGATFGQQIQQAANPPGPGQRAQGRPEEGGQNQPPAVKGLTQATFKGGYTLSFWAADAATGHAREFWHNAPDDRSFTFVNSIQWAGDNVIFAAEPEEWIRYYSVPVAGGKSEPVALTPGEGMAEMIAVSSDGKQLYYSTNAGDIDRRHIWKVPTSGGTAIQLTSGEGIETYPVTLASGDRIAVLSAGAKQPQSVALLSSSGGIPRVIFPSLAGEFPTGAHVVPQN